MKYEQTFWGGKYEKFVDKLNDDVPRTGKVTDTKKPMLEEWRKISNAYYRYYNDGDSFVGKLRFMAKRHDAGIVDNEESLENLADIVFEKALKEKDETLYNRFLIYKL